MLNKYKMKFLLAIKLFIITKAVIKITQKWLPDDFLRHAKGWRNKSGSSDA